MTQKRTLTPARASTRTSTRPADRAATRTGRSPVLLAVLGLMAVLAVAAVLLTRGGADDDPGQASTAQAGTGQAIEQTRPVQVEGAALPRLTQADAAVGSPMPGLSGASFDGTPVRVAADGRPKVVVFLAHWCPHCQRELPEFTRWLAANPQPGADLYAVASGTREERPNFPPSEWFAETGWPRPVLADDADGTAGQAAGLSGYPFFVAVDAAGDVVARTSGEIGVSGLERLVALARGGS